MKGGRFGWVGLDYYHSIILEPNYIIKLLQLNRPFLIYLAQDTLFGWFQKVTET